MRKHLRDFGGEIGTAFQISDDLLDLVGSQEKTGKMKGASALTQYRNIWIKEL